MLHTCLLVINDYAVRKIGSYGNLVIKLANVQANILPAHFKLLKQA